MVISTSSHVQVGSTVDFASARSQVVELEGNDAGNPLEVHNTPVVGPNLRWQDRSPCIDETSRERGLRSQLDEGLLGPSIMEDPVKSETIENESQGHSTSSVPAIDRSTNSTTVPGGPDLQSEKQRDTASKDIEVTERVGSSIDNPRLPSTSSGAEEHPHSDFLDSTQRPDRLAGAATSRPIGTGPRVKYSHRKRRRI